MIYSFGEVLGNQRFIETIKKNILDNKLSHAYIFEGAEGSGKTLLALSFARFLFCETKLDGCKCHSCIQMDAGSHSDLIIVKRGETKSVGVGLIRTAVVNEAAKKPFEYDHKLFIIEEAELMTAEAQNALLRSIEDPPPHAIFILLTKNINVLLTTVLSRCFVYKIKPFGNSTVLDHLEKLGVQSDKALAVSAYSGGSIGMALKLSESELFFEMRRRVNDLLSNSGNSMDLLFSEAEEITEFKEGDLFVKIALIWFRDVLTYKATGISESIFQRDYETKIINSAHRFSFKKLYIGFKSLMQIKIGLSANTPFGGLMDSFIINLCDSGENI